MRRVPQKSEEGEPNVLKSVWLTQRSANKALAFETGRHSKVTPGTRVTPLQDLKILSRGPLSFVFLSNGTPSSSSSNRIMPCLSRVVGPGLILVGRRTERTHISVTT
ncbi:hypothetical protein NDU88_004075 [Pleurodeles waltl]|uniref:Uncharacterized protein n=1 Tax=Pleurodeles waltl TaxID=8319 RepID=A0AAV7VHS3_PLEWA|nr:hypothetical protein NDU88_004075 [Pleurodeles waltl]